MKKNEVPLPNNQMRLPLNLQLKTRKKQKIPKNTNRLLTKLHNYHVKKTKVILPNLLTLNIFQIIKSCIR